MPWLDLWVLFWVLQGRYLLVGGGLVFVREVRGARVGSLSAVSGFGAMVGSFGAVLGGCCFGCRKGRCWAPWLNLWVLSWAGAVLTAVLKPQLATKKNELQINLVAANLGHKAKLLLVQLVLMVT